MQTKEPIKIFIAYSHKDKNYLDRLRTSLKLLERNYSIEVWYDGNIVAGSKWDEEIKKHLYAANIILLLVSTDSLFSDYFYEEEMMKAIERHNRKEATVLPIILRDCQWKSTYLQKLQVLPKGAVPVSTWKDKDAVYTGIAQGIEKCVRNIQGLRCEKNSENTAPKVKSNTSNSRDVNHNRKENRKIVFFETFTSCFFKSCALIVIGTLLLSIVTYIWFSDFVVRILRVTLEQLETMN